MAYSNRIVSTSLIKGTVLSESGKQLTPPRDWAFLPAGDAAITKSVKGKGTTWVVRVRKGKRYISKGIWANEAHILLSQKEIISRRQTPQYKKRRESDLARREVKQNMYVEQFHREVVRFLNFHPRFGNEAEVLAKKVTAHATPVGSGTVARTALIPVGKRAEAAVIAWMRHHTTSYDKMSIPREKGKRKKVRRHLAEKSVEVFKAYRQGREVEKNCPLKKDLV